MEMHFYLSILEILIDGAAVTIHKSSLIFQEGLWAEKRKEKDREKKVEEGGWWGSNLTRCPI